MGILLGPQKCPQQAPIISYQGAGSIMFLARIVDNTILGRIVVTEVININAQR